MKKSLLTFSVLALLAGCTESTPVVETPTEETSQKVMAPQMFYIADLGISEEGGYLLTQNFVTWLSETDGTCRNSADIYVEDAPPLCNPNGFLIVEGDDAEVETTIPAETYVYVNNLGTLLGMQPEMADHIITMDQLMAAFEENSDFFKVTPFEITYGTVMVDGQEMSDQISGINEIYIP